MTTETIRTENQEWGFYGTWSRNESGIDVGWAWNMAVTAITENSERTQEYARDFLDSRMGRHLADAMSEAVKYRGYSLEQALRSGVEAFIQWYEDERR